jgi:hypothetical protein
MTKTVRIFLLAAAMAASSPVLADHVGPSGAAAGGGFTILAPDTLDEGHWALGLRLTYVRPEQRADSELEELAGRHVHAHNTDYNLNLALGAAYGITHRLTLSAELPYVRRDDLREGEHSHSGGQASNAVADLGSVAGVGDLSLLAKYRLLDGEGARLALIGGIKAPTGSTHRRSREGERLETEHQPGTGSWDPIAGAAFGTRIGPVNVTASALYQWSGKGAQHTRLGDRMQSGIALSHRFGEAPGHHHDDGADHEHHHGDELHTAREAPPHPTWDAFLELTGEWEGRQRIAGEIERDSGGKSLWLSPGARFNAPGGLSLGASFGVPLWQRIRQSHPDNDYRLSLSIGRAF